MEAANNVLSEQEGAASLPESGLDAEWIRVLEAAAPVYRERWWPEHNRANLAWIAAVQPFVDRYAGAITKELAKAYGASWPSRPVLTDVTEWAGRTGAYTNINPVHVTVSSVNPANGGPAALEILFHEASHGLILGIRDAISREARAQGRVLVLPDLWHVVLFYTAGDTVARHLDGYTTYAVKNGLYARAWPGAQAALDQDWKPYLEGKIDRETAIRRLVMDYSAPQNR